MITPDVSQQVAINLSTNAIEMFTRWPVMIKLSYPPGRTKWNHCKSQHVMYVSRYSQLYQLQLHNI